MRYYAEALGKVYGNTGSGTDLPSAGSFGVITIFIVSPACADAHDTVDKQADQSIVAAEIGIACVRVELEDVVRYPRAAQVVVAVANCGAHSPVIVEIHANFVKYCEGVGGRAVFILVP